MNRKSDKMKVLFLVNHDVVIYNFRLELVERLITEGYDVIISSPYGERIEDLIKLGCRFYRTEVDRHSLNPLKEWRLFNNYRSIISEINPDIILSYTIKPNIYGAIAATKKKIPFVANITGLGTAVENGGLKQKLIVLMYKFAFRKVQCVFFQNEENQQFFVEHHIAVEKHRLIPGSGVNLERFPLQEYPNDKQENGVIKFAFISRIMKEKGIDQYLNAARAVKKKYPHTEFHICGFCEEEYKGSLMELAENGTVIYHGMIRDVSLFLRDIHCVVHPTYYPEGISNVLLEACASGRPIITTDRSGCREVIDDGINGFVTPQKSSRELAKNIEKFILLPYEEKKRMGINGRKKVEQQFDRTTVVKAYMEEVKKSIEKVCFIRAKQRGNDFVFDGIRKMGYKILIPYKDYNLLLRCLREIWFRLKIPGKSIWFNSLIRNVDSEVFIVKDPLIVPEFLIWMKRFHPASKIILDYDNRVCMSIDPRSVDDVIAEKWSYDADDCNKYGMNLKTGAFLDVYRVDKLESPKYDILYLGRDKGRARKIFDLEEKFKKMGLKTKFYICADRSFLRFRHKYYKPFLPYEKYLQMLKRSRAVLNVVQPGQTSITMREYECVFNNIKCITNNQAIREFELYHPTRYFVLEQDALETLPEFLDQKFVPVPEYQLEKYKYNSMIEEICQNSLSRQ